MFRQILYVHWKAARFLLLPLVVAAFALPLLSVQGLARVEDVEAVFYFLEMPELWAGFFPFLATVGGSTVALTAWSWDHREDHIYALSLPLPRWEYVLLKMGAGLVVLLPFAAALWAGSMAAAASLELPAGVNAYPHLLGARFLMASALAYGILFAMGGSTIRTVMILLTVVVAFVILGELGAGALEEMYPALERFNAGEWLFDLLITWPGPFEVFTGNWMLVDV